jgi:chromosome segregation protein
LKAQVGQNSYAFMGQGLVEEVLTLRPEERRSMIEEAADVRLHRTKLDEARNRLKATRENLDRILLLVAEIEPRLRQLERQADRATTHARLSAELAEALQAYFGQQWQDAQEGLAGGRAVLDQRKEAFDRARREVEACDEGLGSLATVIEERRRDVVQRLEAYRSLEDYRRDLERRITLDEERQRMLTGRRDELLPEIESLHGEGEDLHTVMMGQDERAQTLEQELGAAQAPAAEVQAIEQEEARQTQLRLALANAEASAAQADAQLVEGKHRLGALTPQPERFRAESTSLGEARHEQIASLKAWAQAFARQRQRPIELAGAVRRATETLAEAEGRLAEASAAVSQRREELRTLSVEIDAKQARLETAGSSGGELPAPDAGVRALLAAGGQGPSEEPASDSQVQGLVGMVGQLIRVPAGLERAIEAALADSIYAVVVETQNDALAAAELLVSDDLGRATVFPLSEVRTASPLNLLGERGVVGVASELVRCDNRFRPLVNALLGRTIIAQNLGVASMLLRRGLGSVATIDGILLRPVGSVTAGSARVIRNALAQQRDVGDLPDELERLRAAHSEAAVALETGERRVAEAQRGRDELAAELERLRPELSKVEELLQRHRARLPGAAGRLSALHARLRNAQQDVIEAERALAAAHGDVERAGAKAEQAKSALESLRQEAEELAAASEATARATADRSTRLAALQAEQRVVEEVRAGQAASLARIEEELAHRRELLVRLEEEIATVQGRLDAARAELEAKSQEAEASRIELEPARNEVEQLESRQRTINDELAGARARAIAAERELLDAEANVSLRSEELDALRERLQEEGFSPPAEGETPPPEGDGQPPAWLAADPPAADRPADENALPPMQGGAQIDTTTLKDRIAELRAEIRGLGPVNEQAQTDYAENRERYDFLTSQLNDLQEAEAALQEAIEELERIIKERFSTTFQLVNSEFSRYFQTFFGGGHGELTLTKPDEHGLPGVDIIAQPPRKRVRSVQMLSGGERSLTAVALLFALLQTNPSPICVLDEVDAALDEANVDRFTGALRELAERTQFVIITHNRRTIEMADTIYGVSMGEDSTSTVLSLRLDDVEAR